MRYITLSIARQDCGDACPSELTATVFNSLTVDLLEPHLSRVVTFSVTSYVGERRQGPYVAARPFLR